MNRSHVVSRYFASLWAGLSVVLFSIAARAAAVDPLRNTPPAPPIRIPAEFEPMQAAIVGWMPQADPVLYKRLADDVRLIILLESDESSDEIERHFTKHGVNLDNCEFIETSYGMWERDALPWFAFVDHNVPAFAHSGAEFVDGTPVVLWRTQADASGVWNTLPMVRVPELGEDQYEAYIPGRPVGAVVQYYLQAKDASGRNETHPYIGAPQAHTFTATTLGAGVSAVSAERGADVAIHVNAGQRNGRQSYRLTCSLSSDSENPQDVLPDTTVFTDFTGQLDGFGAAVARLTFPAQLASDWVGTTVCVSLELPDQQDAPMDRVCIEILE